MQQLSYFKTFFLLSWHLLVFPTKLIASNTKYFLVKCITYKFGMHEKSVTVCVHEHKKYIFLYDYFKNSHESETSTYLVSTHAGDVGLSWHG